MMKIKDVELREVLDIVSRRVNRLAMCKRGTLQTDINKKAEDLGPIPKYSSEEQKDIMKNIHKKIQKAMTPSAAEVKKYDDLNSLGSAMVSKAQKIKRNALVHPKRKSYDEAIEKLKLQGKERMAELDGDFQDVIDQFTLGEKDLRDLPGVLEVLEAKEW